MFDKLDRRITLINFIDWSGRGCGLDNSCFHQVYLIENQFFPKKILDRQSPSLSSFLSARLQRS